MPTNAASPSASFPKNLSASYGKPAGTSFGSKAAVYLNCFLDALAMSRVAGDSGTVTPKQVAQLRAMAGAGSLGAK